MDEQIRVLLVDDETSLLVPLAAWLSEHDFIVQTAQNGPEALLKADTAKGDFDVAVIDQLMPPPDGIETMRVLQQKYPHVEVIILTGWADATTGERALQLGASRYMRKPFDKEELALNIRTAARLGRERQGRLALNALVHAGETLGLAQSVPELYERLYQEAGNLLPHLDTFLVARWRANDDTVFFPFCYVRGEPASLPERKHGNGLAEYVIRTKSPLLLPDGDKPFREQNQLDPPHPSLGYCTSEITVPMLYQDRVVGSLHALTFDPHTRYNQGHLAALLAFANQAAVAMQNIEQLDKARRLQAASAALAVCRGADNVMTTIVREAHRLVDSDFTGLILQDRDGTLRRGPRDEPEGFSGCLEEPRQEGGLTRAIIQGRQPRVVADVNADPLVKDDVKKAGIRSLLGVPLIHADRVFGVLYVHTFRPRQFSQHDIDLLSTFGAQAAAALHTAQDEEQDLGRLHAFVDIFRAYQQRRDAQAVVNQIADALCTVLDVDVCTILEYDSTTAAFTVRGAAGLRVPDATYSVDAEYKDLLLSTRKPICIPDTGLDPLTKESEFVKREGIKSCRIYPLWVEERPLGLLFANARRARTLGTDEERGLSLFARLAALVLYETGLQAELAQTRRRLERNMFLTWVSMLEDTWQHSLIQKASAIRNYAGLLLKMMPPVTPAAMNRVKETIQEIDELAEGIANAPVRVPHSFEMDVESIALAPLLQGIAERESRHATLPGQPRVTVATDLDALVGVEVQGWRRWLIYAFEALIDNARNAMPNGGTISITGRRSAGWAEIRLMDEGTGVPVGVRNRLFKELVPKEQDAQGMGLGALLVAAIIEEHGGSVELEKPGPGDTTILIRLPSRMETSGN